MTDSDVVSFDYTINILPPLEVAAPTASPIAGIYDTVVIVRLSTTTDGATIYYTTDGTDPKTSNTRAIFSTSLNIDVNTPINAYATKDGMTDSDVVSFDYTINALSPNVTFRLLDLQRISVNVNGAETTAKPGYVAHSAEPSVSADGRYVAFYSYANNLVQGDINNAEDVFVKDTKDGTVVRVSVTSTGGQSNGGISDKPRITPDGRYVVFRSSSTNLATGNPADDTNTNWDIFVHDRDLDANEVFDEPGKIKTIRVSINSTGEQTTHSNYGNGDPSISDNGRFVCIYDRQNQLLKRLSTTLQGVEANMGGWEVSPVSTNGQYVAFTSASSDLVPNDTNDEDDVFLVSIDPDAPLFTPDV